MHNDQNNKNYTNADESNTTNENYHVPVLVHEVLQYLAPKPGEIYVDATFGGGGHTRAILMAQPRCRVIAIDWDQEALNAHQEAFEREFGDRITFVWGNFAHIVLLLRKQKIAHVNGIIADFGTSQHQIFSGRGFSFNDESTLDMRMSPAHSRVTAAQVVRSASEQTLVEIFKTYGEEPHARAIARAIVANRSRKPITTGQQLADLVVQTVGGGYHRIHPATRVFQALRIYVNRELEAIEHFLRQVPQVLADGGRLVCISFHSLEDRLVKQFFQQHANVTRLTPKIVQPSADEINDNPAARSAKLRAGVLHKV
jgi:16S rRNA (cytosine1402-N4)-methyltransferase